VISVSIPDDIHLDGFQNLLKHARSHVSQKMNQVAPPNIEKHHQSDIVKQNSKEVSIPHKFQKTNFNQNVNQKSQSHDESGLVKSQSKNISSQNDYSYDFKLNPNSVHQNSKDSSHPLPQTSSSIKIEAPPKKPIQIQK
jgi:hypothetical protein